MPISTTSVQSSAKAKAEQKRRNDDKPCGNVALISDQDRQHYVEVAAYYIAERRGFPGCGELDDWLQAEQEVGRRLQQSRNDFDFGCTE